MGLEVVPFRDVAKQTSARSIAIVSKRVVLVFVVSYGVSRYTASTVYLKPVALVKKFSPREFKRKQRNFVSYNFTNPREREREREREEKEKEKIGK